MSIKRIAFIVLGCLSLALAAFGVVLVIVWLGHIYYFGFKVKTLEE